MIGEDTSIECGWCNGISSAKEWNEGSLAECNTREMRRAFIEIYNPKVFKNKSKKSWYKCPKCSMWSSGTQLRIRNNNQYENLGGEPIFKRIKDNNDK